MVKFAPAQLLQTPQGSFALQRYPSRPQEPLQAWCSADVLLLEQHNTLQLAGTATLVVNDEHGALCTALAPLALWTDSALAAISVVDNLQRNERPTVPVMWSTSPPPPASAVLIRIPKQLSYFEYQLATLAKVLLPGTVVLAAGMDKHLSPHTAHIIERYIGAVKRHPGQHKARLFSACTRDGIGAPNYAGETTYFSPELQATLRNLPNVFSRDKLDIGSRFLLQQLPSLTQVEHALDLACGNGVLGLAALANGISSNISFVDESSMALASAKSNARALFPDQVEHLQWHHGDGLLGYTAKAGIKSPELILCNPPFHLNHSVDDFAGKRLIDQCATMLKRKGRLCLVANRHLDYQPSLQRGFERVDKLAQNKKFIVWLAENRLS